MSMIKRLLAGGIVLAVIVAVWFGLSRKKTFYQLPFSAEDVVSVTMCKMPSYGGILRKDTTDAEEISSVYQAVNALKFSRHIRLQNEPIYQLNGAPAYGICFTMKDGSRFFCKGIQNGQGMRDSTENTYTDSDGWSAVVTNFDVLTVFDAFQGEAKEITYFEKDKDALAELDWFA